MNCGGAPAILFEFISLTDREGRWTNSASLPYSLEEGQWNGKFNNTRQTKFKALDLRATVDRRADGTSCNGTMRPPLPLIHSLIHGETE